MPKAKLKFFDFIRDDVQKHQVIRTQWKTIFQLLELEKHHESQQIEMEKSFYLGAGRCLELIVRTSGESPENLEKVIKAIQAEIRFKFQPIIEGEPS